MVDAWFTPQATAGKSANFVLRERFLVGGNCELD
jgi:hypothetical protein